MKRLLAAALLACACGKSPTLAINTPAEGARLSAADDLDMAQPGVQVAVDATTNAEDGTLAVAQAGSTQASARVAAGKLHFERVSIPDGKQSLHVTVGSTTASVSVFADSLARGCRIVSPADGTTIESDPGDTGVFRTAAVIQCRQISGSGRLFVGPGDPGVPVSIGSDGSAQADVDLLPGDNFLVLAVGSVAMASSRVKLDSPRCRTTLSPGSGTLFNLQGGGAAVADRDPAAAGEQARVSASSSCPDGTPATLRAGSLTATSSVSGGAAIFDVTLPDGAFTAQAFTGAPGKSGASKPVSWTVDSQAPSVLLTAPANGQLLADADDASPAPGMQVRFTGSVTGLDSGGSAALVIDEGAAAGGADVALIPGAGGAFSQLVTLLNGSHVARVVARRASGNAQVTPSIVFFVQLVGGRVRIVSPLDGASLGVSKLTPTAGGATAVFAVHADNLAGGTARVQCGSAAGSAVIPASGDVNVSVDLPLPGCGAAQFTCVASASVSGSPVFSSAAITITADAVAPVVTLVSPPAGASSTSQATLDVQATTSCTGEAQTFSVKLGGALAGAGTVSGNAVQLNGLALAGGDNALDVTVTDAAGNTGTASAVVTRLTGTPAITFQAPSPGATLTADADLDLSNGFQAGVRVQVANRPAGSAVVLTVASADAGNDPRAPLTAALDASHVAAFNAVTLPEGNVTLKACVTDPVQPPPAPVCLTEQVVVSSGRATCNLVSPLDGAVLTGPSDTRPDLPGFQTDVQVQTSGDGGVTLRFTAPGGAVTSFPPVTPGAGSGLRTVTISGVSLSGGDGAYRFDATCAASTAITGSALPNTVTLQTSGPSVTFLAPTAGSSLNASAADTSAAPGFQSDVRVQTSAGAQVTLSANCPSTTYGPVTADASGLASFSGVTLLATEGTEGSCALTASAGGGLPTQITVLVDRSVPAPSFTAPQDGATYLSGAPELDCSGSAPVLKTAGILLADALPSGGLLLYVNAAQSALQPVHSGQAFTWSNVPLAAGDNTLAVAATDAAGNRGTAQVNFVARCSSSALQLDLFANGTKLGYAQDKDHTTAGEQLGVSVTSSAAPDGAQVRICSTLGNQSQAACDTAGTWPLADAGAQMQGGSALFDQTLPDGAQQLVAELVGGAVSPSGARAVTVRATPPRVTALTIAENLNGDLALNQSELAATLHFNVTVQGAVAGQVVEIHSGNALLGSAVAGSPVPVPLSAVSGSGGYQQHVFYALVFDDAGNPDSVPGAEYPSDPAFTLGTAAQPFVIAPNPSVTLDRPAVAKLLAADDTRCSGGTCPGADPLSYSLAGSTSAPDGSTAQFLLDGAAIGGGVSLSGGAFSGARSLANGAARALAVRVSDPYGNVVTSAAKTVLIDSVPPSLTLVPPSGPITTPQSQVTVQTGASLESGQAISVTSDVDGVVGTAQASGSSTQVTISLLHNGTHVLTAKASDAAGNPGSSAPVSVTFNYAGPGIALTQPAPSAGTAWFGGTTQCAPPLSAATQNAPDGSAATLYVVSAADCTGARGKSANGSVSGNAASFSLSFADGESGFLCAEVTVASQTARTPPQAFACDLQNPQLTFAAPVEGQLYVAAPLGARAPAIASKGSDPAVLVVDLSLTATAKKDTVVKLFADGTLFAAQTLAADCAACTVSFPSAQLPVSPGQPLAHALTATAVAPSGNSGNASRGIKADISPPADAAPSLVIAHRLAGVVHVNIASAPGDDGGSGAAPALWQVRWSATTPLTRANWDTTGVLLDPALVPAPASPGQAQGFDVVLPADTAALFIGVRAADRVGNLGAFTDQAAASPTLSLTLQRDELTVPNTAGNVAARLRVADLDGDGFDDVVLSYPGDAGGNGALYVYFGSASGLSAAPLTLTGAIPGGLLGYGQSFDVGDFDGDGKADVAAAATDCASAAVYLWTGASIAAARAASSVPAPLVLTSGSALIGGTVRAGGHVTGQAGAGDDLIVSGYTAGCGGAQDYSLALLPRGGGWLAGTAGLLGLASAHVTLPSGHDFGTAEAAAIGPLEGAASRDTLFVSFIDSSSSPLAEQRVLAGSALTGTVALTSGRSIPNPNGGGTAFGFYAAGRQDAVGDATLDLALSGDKRVFVYDGAALLTGTPAPALTLDVTAEPPAEVGSCVGFLPDLDGDGKAELFGCANVGVSAPNFYFAFGGTGPSLSFFDPNPPNWKFTPHRGQRLSRSGAFGQKAGAGRLTGSVGLVVLSETGTSAAKLTLLR